MSLCWKGITEISRTREHQVSMGHSPQCRGIYPNRIAWFLEIKGTGNAQQGKPACPPSRRLMRDSFCPQSFPASGSFQMSQLFTSGGQSIGVSAPTSVLPMNTQDWSPLGWTGWISLQSKGLFKSPPTPQLKSINSSARSFLDSPTLTSIHDHRKNHSLN